MISELRRAFEIGFLLFIPFLVVDMVIANLLLALGMHMLSPTTISMPFKLLLFVMVDDTRNCDEVGAYLEKICPELQGTVLVIHTKNNGEISESASGKSKEELELLLCRPNPRLQVLFQLARIKSRDGDRATLNRYSASDAATMEF